MTNKITFDAKGNPLPYEVIKLNGSEFKQIFVDDFKDSSTREKIFAGHQNYNKNMLNLIKSNYFQIADGSFTTNKQNPNDIDIVSFLSHISVNEHGSGLTEFQTKNGSKDNYFVDGYIIPYYPKTNPLYAIITKDRIDYWYDWFGHDRSGNPKALIRLEFRNE